MWRVGHFTNLGLLAPPQFKPRPDSRVTAYEGFFIVRKRSNAKLGLVLPALRRPLIYLPTDRHV